MGFVKRFIPSVWIVILFGAFIFNLSIPYMRDFALAAFVALPKWQSFVVEAMLIQIIALGSIWVLIAQRPRPYGWSVVTVWNYLRKVLRAAREGKSIRTVSLTPEEEFGSLNINFIALDVPYVRMAFIVLLVLNVPILAAVEEIIFRDGKVTLGAVLLWGMLFALVHLLVGFRLAAMPATMLIALLLSMHYLTGGLVEAIMVHVIVNLIGVGLLVWFKVFWPDIKPRVVNREWYRRFGGAIASERIRPQMPECLKGGE